LNETWSEDLISCVAAAKNKKEKTLGSTSSVCGARQLSTFAVVETTSFGSAQHVDAVFIDWQNHTACKDLQLKCNTSMEGRL